MFRKITISTRMIILLVFMLVFSLAVGSTMLFYMFKVEKKSLSEAELVMQKGYERTLQTAVESMATQLADIHAKATAEGLDAEDAIRMGIRKVRYGEKGYFFIYNTAGFTVAHPLKPKLDGRAGMEKKDKKGKQYIKELVGKVKRGGGFVTYWFPKPGETEPSPKLAYGKAIGKTGYWIATGMYIDDIITEKEELTDKLNTLLSKALLSVGIGVGLILFLIVLPFSFFLIKSILTPLKAATNNAQEVAKGNLAVQVEVNGMDEITRLEEALALMISTLARNIEDIEAKSLAAEQKAQDAETATAEAEEARTRAERARSEGMHTAAARLETVVGRVTDASEDISRRSDEIRNGADTQSHRISETATAMEEMNCTVLEVARNSSDAASVGTEAKIKAQNGADIVRRSNEAMQITQKQTLQVKDNMTQLETQTKSIGNIMTVIEDIADQTNLLALNAAIEAARAGEAGRGFAVVADEVRKLAEKTMNATKEVGNSIKAIQDGTRTNVQSVEKAVKDMDTVTDLTNQSGIVLDEIVAGVETSSDQIQGIATAAEEQSATSEEINRSITEINDITQKTSQGVAKTTIAVRELAQQTMELRDLVQELKKA